MTFEQFQQQRGRNTSNQQDYQEYMAFLNQQGGPMSKAVAKKQIAKTGPSAQNMVSAAPSVAPTAPTSPVSRPATAPSSPVSQMSQQGSGVDVSKAMSVLEAYKKNPVAKQELLNTESIDRMNVGDSTGMFGDTKFTGNAMDVAQAGMMAMQTTQAETAGQAIMGGLGTGLSVSSMLAGSAAGPVGIAAGVGTALIGLSSASSKRRKREQELTRQREEAERLRKRSEKLRAEEKYADRRQQAYSQLMGAFR